MESRLGFVGTWIFFTVVAWLVGVWIQSLAARIGIGINILPIELIISCCVALAHWVIVLREIIPFKRALLISLLSAFTVTCAFLLITPFTDSPLQILVTVRNSILIGASFSLPQWWFGLRVSHPRSIRWIFYNILGTFAALLVLDLIPSSEAAFLIELLALFFINPALFGLITGLAIHSIVVRKPKLKYDEIPAS